MAGALGTDDGFDPSSQAEIGASRRKRTSRSRASVSTAAGTPRDAKYTRSASKSARALSPQIAAVHRRRHRRTIRPHPLDLLPSHRRCRQPVEAVIALELRQRIDEAEPVIVPHERDRVAGPLAAPAARPAARRVDREAVGLRAVKKGTCRAASRPGRASPPGRRRRQCRRDHAPRRCAAAACSREPRPQLLPR